jgi:hypothetical protein
MKKTKKEFDPDFLAKVEEFRLAVCEELARNPNWGNELKELLENFKKKDKSGTPSQAVASNLDPTYQTRP